MPPAFVLSQDQTLHQILSLAHSLTCLRFSRFFTEKLEFLRPHYLSIMSSHLVLFAFNCLIFKELPFSAALRQLLYITTSPLLCQHLFFFLFFGPASRWRLDKLYPLSPLLSIPFFSLFSPFFLFLFLPLNLSSSSFSHKRINKPEKLNISWKRLERKKNYLLN